MWYQNEEMTENEEIDKNHTLSDMARLDKSLLSEVITLYMTWYDENWQDYTRTHFTARFRRSPDQDTAIKILPQD